MYSRAPRHIPPLSVLFDGLPKRPTRTELAKFWDVSVRTVDRYLADDYAPRPLMLALFWESKWGQETVYNDTLNELRGLAGLAEARRREAEQRLAEVQHLMTVGNFGSANQPILTADAGPVAIRPPAAQDDGTRPFLPTATPQPAAYPARQGAKRTAVRG